MFQKRNQTIKLLGLFAGIVLLFFLLGFLLAQGILTPSEPADENPEPAYASEQSSTPAPTHTAAAQQTPEPSAAPAASPEPVSSLTGAALNGTSCLEERITYKDNFYYEPLSDDLRDFITGISYPEDLEAPAVTLDELSYLHVLYYDFDGKPAEGELICNQNIAGDLAEIFYELYQNEYRIERIRLIDEYGGDDEASMADNNTSCFNYRVIANTASISRHAYGLAIDINPFYNPCITYNGDGSSNISPEGAEIYADRSGLFPYKIDETDLCYKLFTEHGFTWGGDWNSLKDYQHFQKSLE